MKLRQDGESYRKAIYAGYSVHFQDAGETFDVRSAVRWGKAYSWYLRSWLPERKNAAIGELGCGNGKLLHFFKQGGYTNLLGVDISPDQVALARQVVPNVEQANVLDWLASRPQCFDLLIALDLVEHLLRDEVLRFFDLCFAAINPGGRLILQTPNADSPFGMAHRYNDITHEWAFNVKQLARLLRRAGFTKIEAREQGPAPWGYSLFSTIRYCMWRGIRIGLTLWNVIETGNSGSGVLTRVFLVSGVRK